MNAQNTNVDHSELEKFSSLAHRWWDPGSEFKPLHVINPVRLRWIDSVAPVRAKQVLDIGCGGGILAESMAQQGAQVTGIDMAEKPLGVARLHSLESGVRVDYRLSSAEALAEQMPGAFDIVTCMEMLEHVPNPASVIVAASRLAKPGADVFFSTINRNLKAYLMAIIGAEYVLRLLPRGTHDYAKLITPSELARAARAADLDIVEIKGMSYNPITHSASLNDDTDVNYLVHARKRVAT